jgi:nucleoside-diphosphate-sugar epimerase
MNTEVDSLNNNAATRIILESMRTSGRYKKIIFISSSVYGKPDVIPTPEGKVL